MSYDIPPQLHHKEKIIFGLTFSQLGYAFPAFFIIFLILKSGLSIEIGGALSIFVVLIAAFFMFFDGKNRIVNLWKYIRNQSIDVNNEKLKEIVDIKKVEKDTVYTSKTKLAILEVIPLNFMIKSEEEKQSIISGFQKFLNSLDFPIQIHISSNIISLDEHFKCLKAKTEKYEELYNSYKEFIEKSITDNGIKNRKFYIVINEKDSLELQAKVCEDKLKSLGLKVNRLKEKELLDYFYDYVASKQKKELKENQTVENYTHFLLAPQKVTFHHDLFKVDDKFCKLLSVTGYPHSVEEGFLDKIISSGDNYDISIHIQPYQIEDTMIQLNRDLQKQQADLYADSKKGILNPSLEIKFKSTKAVLEDLQKGKQKLFDVSLYIMCKANIKNNEEEKAKKEASLLAKKVKSDLDGLMIQSKIPVFQMVDSYKSMLPLGKDTLKIKRNIHTSGLSAFFPFSSPFLDIENEGILLGLNKNKIPYIKDIFKLTNANGIILATSGAGKSYFTKLLISRMFLNGSDIIIIDPQGEYLSITEHYKGETITISKNSDTIINPLDLMGHEYLEKRLSLMDLFRIMFGDLTEIQKSILDMAVDLTYAKKGINRDSWQAKTPPKMEDLHNTLNALENKCAQQEKVTYRALLNRLRMYTESGVFSFLNKDTNIDFSKNFVCFNIGNMPKQVKPVVMYLVLDYVYMRMKDSLKRKILVIDEAWAMLQTAEESSYVFEIVKTCRKFNLGLLMITQDVADLVASKAGHAVLANTSYTFLLRQKPAVISGVVKTFNLSNSEKDYLISAEKGKGILILENEHQELEVIASEKEHELITTNPDEMVAQGEKKKGKTKEHEDININLDIERDVYLAEGLNIEQCNFLVNHGYERGNYHGLEKGRQKEYFVKIRHPESTLHTYCVNMIYQEIKKYTDNVSKYRTEKPDILFINKKGEEIAIEVETGFKSKFDSKKKYLDEKFSKLKKKYGDRCYIFLPTTYVENSYKRFNIPLLFRLNISDFVKSKFSPAQSILSDKNQTTQVPNS